MPGAAADQGQALLAGISVRPPARDDGIGTLQAGVASNLSKPPSHQHNDLQFSDLVFRQGSNLRPGLELRLHETKNATTGLAQKRLHPYSGKSLPKPSPGQTRRRSMPFVS